MKRIAPDAEIIDITHGIPAQSVLQGALVLSNTIGYMPVGIHLAVVDPGVGGPRRPLALRDGEGRLIPHDERPIARVMRGESYAQLVLDVTVTSTGAHFVGSHSGTPVLDESGAMIMGVVTVHDVSDIHAAQERERRELETTQTLLEVARAVGTWTEIDQLLRNVAALVLRSSGAQRVSIGLLGPENDEVRIAAVAGDNGEYEHASVPVSSLPDEMADMLQSGSTVLVDYETVPPGLRAIALAGSKLVLHVPIIYGSAPIGWIAVDDPNERRHSVPREVDIIEAVASQTAVAIENARRYKAEHDIAERLQTALLELPAVVPGISYATLYQSASMSARVGGDFYDLFDIDGDCVGITVGDVAGKGLNAAALTAVVKNTIRAHATDPGRSPERVLELTNELLFRSTPPESFVTVWFGILDIRSGRLRYANAGHPAGLIVHPDGSTDVAAVSAPVLGAVREIKAAPGTECRLDPGSVLFLHTDGLTEARVDREMFGDERLATLIQSLAGRSPEDLVNTAAQTVLDFTGGRLLDDVAILALRIGD
jgi:serine phosphatase RsbU (regulator of sigma subunit)